MPIKKLYHKDTVSLKEGSFNILWCRASAKFILLFDNTPDIEFIGRYLQRAIFLRSSFSFFRIVGRTGGRMKDVFKVAEQVT